MDIQCPTFNVLLGSGIFFKLKYSGFLQSARSIRAMQWSSYSFWVFNLFIFIIWENAQFIWRVAPGARQKEQTWSALYQWPINCAHREKYDRKIGNGYPLFVCPIRDCQWQREACLDVARCSLCTFSAHFLAHKFVPGYVEIYRHSFKGNWTVSLVFLCVL